MQVLIISSEKLYPQNTHPSTFELTQAKYLKRKGINVCIASVFLLTTQSLIVSAMFKLAGKSSVNFSAGRFSFFQLIRLLFLSVFNKNHVQLMQHVIDSVNVIEAIGFKPKKADTIMAILPYWINAGKKAADDYLRHNKVDVVHAHSRFLFAQALAFHLKNENGIPYVLTEHSSKVLDGSLSEELTHQIKDYYEAAALVLAVSRAVAEKLQRLFNLKALEVMPNMLDDLYLQPLHKKPINLVFTIASVGRLDKNKNQILIIEAMPYLKAGNAILKILGDGATKEDLHNTVGNLKLSEKVAFKGHLPSWQIRQELLSADVLVITSKVETFSVVAIEALACGLPVITTKCGGPQDIITEENGEIVGYDSSEMANAINKMISGEKTYDPITIRANCLKKYSGDVVAENLQKKYEEIIRS